MYRLIARALPWLLAMPIFGAGASAQLPIPKLSLAGGVSHYDFGTSGTSAIGALRLEVPLVTLVGEGSLAVFRPTIDGVARTALIPEAQLQWQFSPVLVRPYIGVGGGWIVAVSGPSPHPTDGTLSASAGVRVGIPFTPFTARGEVRLRTMGSGTSRHATELTLGASW
jgi:hypothetical protein